jgi:hypothetical protein
MVSRRRLIAIGAGGLAAGWAAPAEPAAGSATPVASPVAGVIWRELAMATVDRLPGASARIRLERLVVPAGVAIQVMKTRGPELLAPETGDLVVGDDLGLEAPLAAGQLLPGGVDYFIRKDGDRTAALLRLTLRGSRSKPAEAIPLTPAATPAARASAEEVAAGVVAKPAGTPPPVADGVVLLDAPVSALPEAPARLFIARAIFVPTTDTGLHMFNGPVGFVVETGALAITGPAGIEGRIEPGDAIILPAAAPNRQRNPEGRAASALVVGVLLAGQPLVAPSATPVA